MPEENTIKKIGAASIIMMASVFLSRLTGIIREMAIAGIGGIKPEVDAYQIAFIIPEILNHVVAAGFLSITFIPIITQYLVNGEDEKGYQVFSIIHNTFGLILVCLIAVTMIWTPALVSVFAPGIKDPATFDMAVKMTRIILPAQFFFFSGGLFMAVQFAREKFFIPALAPLTYNLGIILGGLVLGRHIGMEGFSWGVLAGAFFGSFLLQVFGARRLGLKHFFIFSLNHPDLIRYVKLSLPLMLGLTMTFSMEILLKFFGSFLDPGRIAAMNYAMRIMFILVGFFGQAVGVASYPYLARLAQEKAFDRLNQVLNTTLKYILLVIPVSVLFTVLSHEIVRILFQRGDFTAQATHVTAGILPFFMIGAVAVTAQTLVSRGYYAMQDTLFPAIVTTLCVTAGLPVIYLLMNLLGAKGVALGLSITLIVQCIVLFECWNKKSRNTEKSDVYRFFIKLIPLSLLLWLALKGFRTWLITVIDPAGFLGSLCVAALISILCCAFMWGYARLFNIPEIDTLTDRLLRLARLRR